MKEIYEIEVIKARLMTREIDYDEAKLLAEPVIKRMNEKAAGIALKHGKRPPKFSFSGLMR